MEKNQARRRPHKLVIVFFLILAVVLVYAAYRTHGKLPKFPPGKPAPEKKYTSVTSFYPVYRSKHSNNDSLCLHLLATALALFFAWLKPRFVIVAVISIAVGTL